ncbi:unnamed protein product [Acanthosepion pharaonis]|uniref:CCHC-type domain-containing protein n=1 Tax=Acanthosepion pharaonis TaxID=158019 RepID=A0A812DWU5_ACAPH|nr:unnamed protein product [Sepia pharaonis]
MCRFSDMDSEVKSQLITGCLSEKVRQKGLMNSDMSLHDLINYARTTETIASHLQTMRLEDNNTATATTAPINKVADEQRQPSNYPRQYQCRNCNGKYPHERGPTSCPAFHTQCTHCGMWGHFTSVCFRRLNDGDRQRKTNRPPRTQTNRLSVNRTENDQRNPHSSGSDTEYVFHTAGARNFPPPIEMDTPANRSSSLFLGLPNQIKGQLDEQSQTLHKINSTIQKLEAENALYKSEDSSESSSSEDLALEWLWPDQKKKNPLKKKKEKKKKAL